MPRIRTIKPGFFAHEGLSSVSDLAQLLAGGLLCYADDYGYFDANPLLIKAAVFPLRVNVDRERIVELCHELASIKPNPYVRFGTGRDGKRYGHVVGFEEHQKVSHPTASRIKKMDIVWEIFPKFTEPLRKTTEPLRPEWNKEEERNKERELKPSARKARGAEVNNSQVAKAAGETRHSRLHELIMSWYQEWAGVECPWGGGEGRNLKRMLDSTPNWLDQQFISCLENLAKSECIPKGERPREWLEKLPKFLHGPLDRFWKPIGSTNGRAQSTSKADVRERRIVENALKYRAVAAGATAGESTGSLAVSRNGSTGVCGLDGEPEIIPPGKDSGSSRPPDV